MTKNLQNIIYRQASEGDALSAIAYALLVIAHSSRPVKTSKNRDAGAEKRAQAMKSEDISPSPQPPSAATENYVPGVVLLSHSDLRVKGIKYSMSQINRKMKEGSFPKSVKGFSRALAWSEPEIDLWVDGLLKQRK